MVVMLSGRFRGERGQAILEWALIMPLLVFLVLGVFVLSILINTKLGASGAAREAARNYAIYGDGGRAGCVAGGYLYGTLLAGAVADCRVSDTGAAQWESGERCQSTLYVWSPIPEQRPAERCAVEIYAPPAPADRVEVRVTYWQHVFVPGLYRLLGDNRDLGSGAAGLEDRLPISAAVVFRREQ